MNGFKGCFEFIQGFVNNMLFMKIITTMLEEDNQLFNWNLISSNKY